MPHAVKDGSIVRNVTKTSVTMNSLKPWNSLSLVKTVKRYLKRTSRKKPRPDYNLTSGRQDMEEADEFCPYCDNHFVIEVQQAQPVIAVEGDDPRILRDHRIPQKMIEADMENL